LLYRELAPPPALAPFVRCFWTLSGEGGGASERILPDGSFELIFHRAQPFGQDGRPQPRSMLMGEIRRPVIVSPRGAIDVVGVRFRAGGAAPFFRMPMSELRDRMTALDDLDDAESMAAYLERRLVVSRHQRLARGAVAEIRRTRGALRVHELAKRLGTTERTLGRAFEDVVGIGPKQFSRLARFHAALRHDDGLAYYDQSHRIHEFHAIAGVTPTDFLRERNAINDAFVGNLQSP
jgi:AraC-like DNA-binding protein